VSEPHSDRAENPESAETTLSGGRGDALFAAVYDRLKAVAGRRLAAHPGASLQTTALVHEVYLRMHGASDLAFRHPSQFFTYAARAMRHLLSDRARDRLRIRAGGGWLRVTLTGVDQHVAIDSAEQAIALESAMLKLESEDVRAAQVVELLYFAGLTLEQTADILGLTRRTIDRDWRFARAFLKSELG
jgi:RNA polymerase sigma factor (TIGR02999 family)